jgi:predicted Zn-dependent peptidase
MNRREAIQVLSVGGAALAAGCYSAGKNPAGTLGGDFLLPSQSTQRVNDLTITTLTNGLTIIHRQTTSNAIVGLVALVRCGASQEDAAATGQTNLMMRVLSKGTEKRTSDQIAEEIGQLGASLSPSAGLDHSRVSLQCVNSDLEQALELFADVLLNPTFPVTEVDLERQKVLASIRMADDQTAAVTTKRFRAELFGSHPYGRPLEGLAATLPGITAPQLHQWHRDHFVPSNMIISVVGNVPTGRVVELMGKYLGAPALPKTDRIDVDKIITPAASRSLVRKKSQQGYVVLGHLTCPADHVDSAAVEVASNVLGGGMSSRLFTVLRDQQSLAYSVGSAAYSHRYQGYLMTFIGTKPETLKQAEDGLWSQVRRLRDEPVGEAELQRAKNYIAGGYLRAHERNMQQAGYLAYWHAMGKGVEYDQLYLNDINAVDVRDVMRIANKYFLDPTVVVLEPEQAATT